MTTTAPRMPYEHDDCKHCAEGRPTYGSEVRAMLKHTRAAGRRQLRKRTTQYDGNDSRHGPLRWTHGGLRAARIINRDAWLAALAAFDAHWAAELERIGAQP